MNQALIDIIVQHFFKNTPTSFALSYFSLYLDYCYPKGGTAAIIDGLNNYILDKGGDIKTRVSIKSLQPGKKCVTDSQGNCTGYSNLIWACDLKQLYNVISIDELKDSELIQRVKKKRDELKPLMGGDSIFTVYLTVDENNEYFSNICAGHFFYTPDKRGLSTVSKSEIENFLSTPGIDPNNLEMKNSIKKYLLEYFSMNTFEIVIPVLRDPALAPGGKVGLEVSLFMDYSLDKRIDEYGWTKEMRDYMEHITIDILNETIFPGIKEKVAHRFSSSPLTIERLTGNTHGAITGWAFTNSFVPAVKQMLKVNCIIIDIN